MSAAALLAARDELPPDPHEAMVAPFGMQADLRRLRDVHGIDSGAPDDALYAMREALEEAIVHQLLLSGPRWTPARFQLAPPPPPALLPVLPRGRRRPRLAGPSSSPAR